ncbi:MAG: alpha/beta hydrolase [Deltaproteobacteria bacterium]|nr:alpha/beta hydrolase [Deltaproteobacteria bacterium]
MRCTPAFAGLIYEEIRVETQDGISISGWWVPTVRPKGTVLFCHGNGGNIASYLDPILLGNRLGLDVFIFDYRGYGYSGGTPTESGTYLDADAAWKYLVTERGIAPEQIIVWGRSLGGAIAARTAAVHPAGLVIVESTFTSLRDLVNDRFSWVPSCIVADYAYDTRHHLEQVYVPVLVIHSPDDEMIPFRHGKMLYDAIKGPKAFLEIKGSHNRGYLDSMDVYVSGIMDFVSRYMENEEVSK